MGLFESTPITPETSANDRPRPQPKPKPTESEQLEAAEKKIYEIIYGKGVN